MKNKSRIQKLLMYTFGVLAVPFLFLNSHTSAASLSTAFLDIHYAPDGVNSYRWNSNMAYGTETGGTQNYNFVNMSTGSGYANLYQFTTPTTNTTGNYASIHFETNIVMKGVNSSYVGNFVNLSYIQITACVGQGAFSGVQMVSSSVSTAVTNWNNGANKTLTVYGDVVLRNIQANSSGYFTCQIGNPNYAFLSTANTFSTTYINRLYFEKNPGYIEYSNNINDALLQMQISQNDTIINNQAIIAEGVGQTTDAVNNLHDWMADDTPASVDTSVLGNSVGWLPAGPVDSILTLPLQLLRGIVDVFTNTNCAPLVVPVPFVNSDITLPCISTLMDDIGFTPVWSLVGGVISAVIIWQTLKWLYKFVDDTLTFRENNSGMWGGL